MQYVSSRHVFVLKYAHLIIGNEVSDVAAWHKSNTLISFLLYSHCSQFGCGPRFLTWLDIFTMFFFLFFSSLGVLGKKRNFSAADFVCVILYTTPTICEWCHLINVWCSSNMCRIHRHHYRFCIDCNDFRLNKRFNGTTSPIVHSTCG